MLHVSDRKQLLRKFSEWFLGKKIAKRLDGGRDRNASDFRK